MLLFSYHICFRFVLQHHVAGDRYWSADESAVRHFNTLQPTLRQTSTDYWGFQ